MTRNHKLAGFVDEVQKLALRKRKKLKEKPQQDTMGKKPWMKGSPYSAMDDPQDIAAPYDRDGANAQHHSFEAENSENTVEGK